MSRNKEFSITSAERYSLALFELSEENNLLSSIEDQASSMLDLINENNDFYNLIKDPTIRQEDLSKLQIAKHIQTNVFKKKSAKSFNSRNHHSYEFNHLSESYMSTWIPE